METKKFTFSDESEIHYSTLNGGHIIIEDIFEFEPYKGYTLKEALDYLDVECWVKETNVKILDDICYDFGDDGFKKNYKMEMGMKGGRIAAAIANYCYVNHDLESSKNWKENDVVVGEDWTFFDCITVDSDYKYENEDEYKQEVKYLKRLIVDNPDFSEFIKPIIEYMKDPRYRFYIIQYGYRYF